MTTITTTTTATTATTATTTTMSARTCRDAEGPVDLSPVYNSPGWNEHGRTVISLLMMRAVTKVL